MCLYRKLNGGPEPHDYSLTYQSENLSQDSVTRVPNILFVLNKSIGSKSLLLAEVSVYSQMEPKVWMKHTRKSGFLQ